LSTELKPLIIIRPYAHLVKAMREILYEIGYEIKDDKAVIDRKATLEDVKDDLKKVNSKTCPLFLVPFQHIQDREGKTLNGFIVIQDLLAQSGGLFTQIPKDVHFLMTIATANKATYDRHKETHKELFGKTKILELHEDLVLTTPYEAQEAIRKFLNT